jgi:hypothetical protein
MRITSENLLKLMHFNHRGARMARRLVVTPTGYDWEGRPEDPPHPGTWIGALKGPGYYRFHRAESVPDDVAAFLRAEAAHANYPRDWPEIPGKAVRKCLRRGWLAESGGLISVTPEGRAYWHMIRFGRPEGATRPQVGRNRKRRPQGAALMFSKYRWHVQGRNRGGSTPQPAPHIRLRAMGAIGKLADEPDPPPREDVRRRGWEARRKSRRTGER